jgi:hypothetical protein
MNFSFSYENWQLRSEEIHFRGQRETNEVLSFENDCKWKINKTKKTNNSQLFFLPSEMYCHMDSM